MTAPRHTYTLGLYDIVGLWDGVRRDHWHGGVWVHDDPTEQKGYTEMAWYAGGSNIYMRLTGEPQPQIWQIVDIAPEELRLRHAKQDYVFRRLAE
jgi:hypothetical protein